MVRIDQNGYRGSSMSYLECILKVELTGLPYGLDVRREEGAGGGTAFINDFQVFSQSNWVDGKNKERQIQEQVKGQGIRISVWISSNAYCTSKWKC